MGDFETPKDLLPEFLNAASQRVEWEELAGVFHSHKVLIVTLINPISCKLISRINQQLGLKQFWNWTNVEKKNMFEEHVFTLFTKTDVQGVWLYM